MPTIRERVRALSPTERLRYETIAEQFDEAWSASPDCPPDISVYVPSDEPIRTLLLVALITTDMEQRHGHSAPWTVEDYLTRHPELVSDQAAVAELVSWEYGLAGPDERRPEDCYRRFPAVAEILRRRLEAPTTFRQWGTPPGYTDLQEIGRGGIGVVYVARHVKLDRKVALKVLTPHFAIDCEALVRFELESKLVANLEHPNIIGLHEVGTHEGLPFYAMEYCPGGSLKDRLNDSVMEPREAARVTETLASAVQTVHDQGVIHRDLKPGNVLVAADGTLKLTDFGLAKSREDLNLTRTREAMGTPYYMAPEQFEGARDVDNAADVYGLGAILYHCLTQFPPVRGRNWTQVRHNILTRDPVRPSTVVNVPRDLETICLKCLEKEPDKRYGTAADLVDDLHQFLLGEPIRARPPGLFERATRWIRRNRWKAAAVFSALAVVVLVAALAITRTIAAEQERRLRSQAEGLAQKEQVSRIRAEGLAWREQEHRKRAEGFLRLAEARQAALHYQLIKRALQEKDFDPALDALGGFPRSQRSLETRILEGKLHSRPQVSATLVDDYWGIVASVASPDAKYLVTSYATGTVLLWNLDTGKVASRLSEGRWSEEIRRRLHYFEARPKDSKMADWGPCYTALAWLANSERVVGVSLDGTVTLFDLKEDKTHPITRLDEPLYAAASSADGAGVVCGGKSGKLYSVAVTGGSNAKGIDGDSAVTAIRSLLASSGYLVGRADGTIELRSAEDLSSHANWSTNGPVWGFDAQRVDDGWLVTIACEAPEITVLRLRRADSSIQEQSRLRPPEMSGQPLVYHAVHFAQSGHRVRALSSLGRLTEWDLATEEVNWSNHVLGQDPRRALQPLAEGLPLPLRRVGSLILERSPQDPSEGQTESGKLDRTKNGAGTSAVDGNRRPSEIARKQIIVTGDDGVIYFLEASQALQTNGLLNVTVGKKPRLCFDPDNPNLLWALNQDGMLSVVDCRADACLASQKAHAGQSADLTVVKIANVVGTVGGDNLMRFWRYKKGQLESPRKAIRHDEALISMAASPDGRWVAAVDVTARMIVWDYATGKQLFLSRLTTDGAPANGRNHDRPLTGRLSFSPDGSRLAAFGASQVACVFETSPFRRSPEQVWIAGRGGTALIWSSAAPGLLIAADDFPRFVATEFGEPSEVRRGMPFNPASPCVAMAITPDARRLILLEQTGHIHFLDAEHLVKVLDLQAKSQNATDLAIDPRGRYLAVAATDGSIELWSGPTDKQTPRARIEDTAYHWTSSMLIEPTSRVLRCEPRMVQVNRHGQVGVLSIESKPGDFRSEGALHFVDEAGGYARRERLEIGGGAYTRRASAESTALVFAENNQPVAVFRLRTAVSSAYDGAIYIATRVGRDQWTSERVHEHGNMGFSPLLRLDDDGLPAELVHFSFDGFYLVRSTPNDKAGGDWNAEPIGWQGDGMGVAGGWSTDGTLHVVFRRNRFNSDPRNLLYASSGGRELSRHVIDPFQSISTAQVGFASDCSPIVLVGKRLMRLGAGGWVEYASLPLLPVESFAINRQGDVSFITRDAETERIVLCEGRGNSWSATAITQFPDGTQPNFWTLRLDQDDQPVIIVACLDEPYGWLCVLRRQE